MEIYIYTLCDPREPQVVRYVGVTKNPKVRLAGHLKPRALSYPTYKNHWVKKLLAENVKPSMAIIDRVDESRWAVTEQYWVRYYRERGDPITNSTDGGEGALNMPPEIKKKIGAAAKKRMAIVGRTPEYREMASKRFRLAWKQGKYSRVDHSAVRKKAWRGGKFANRKKPKPLTEEQLKARGIAQKKSWTTGIRSTPEFREKHRRKVSETQKKSWASGKHKPLPPFSKEHRARLSKSISLAWRQGHFPPAKPFTAERCKKISEAQKRAWAQGKHSRTITEKQKKQIGAAKKKYWELKRGAKEDSNANTS